MDAPRRIIKQPQVVQVSWITLSRIWRTHTSQEAFSSDREILFNALVEEYAFRTEVVGGGADYDVRQA